MIDRGQSQRLALEVIAKIEIALVPVRRESWQVRFRSIERLHRRGPQTNARISGPHEKSIATIIKRNHVFGEHTVTALRKRRRRRRLTRSSRPEQCDRFVSNRDSAGM